MSKNLLSDQTFGIEKALNYTNTKLAKAVVILAGYVSVQEVFKDNYLGAAGFGSIALGFALAAHNDHSRFIQEDIPSDEK